MAKAERGLPYDSAKEHYILDVEDRELVELVTKNLCGADAYEYGLEPTKQSMALLLRKYKK